MFPAQWEIIYYDVEENIIRKDNEFSVINYVLNILLILLFLVIIDNNGLYCYI